MKLKKFTALTFALGLSLILSNLTLSQNKVITAPKQDINTINSMEITPNLMPGAHQMPVKETPAHEKELLQELEDARMNNNFVLKEQAEKELDAIHGSSTALLTSGQHGLPGGVNTFANGKIPPFENDSYSKPINTGSILRSISTCTNPVGFPNAGRIWCVYSVYGGAASDTLKTVYSDDWGSSWISYASYDYSIFSVKFRNSELKVIPVYDGTNMYLFIAASVDFLGEQSSQLYRYNVTAGTFFGADIAFPGEGHSYDARVCTDNSVYTTNEYVYLIASQDSVTTGTRHHACQKFALLLNPGAVTPTITYRGADTVDGSFWEYDEEPYAEGEYLYSDIAFFKDYGGSGKSRIMVTWNYYYHLGAMNDNRIDYSYSDDYGLTHAGGGFVFGVPLAYTRGAKIAFNGGGTSSSPNRNGMIVVYSLWAGTDWDVLSYNTTDGGSLDWTTNPIDNSTNHASGLPDLIAEWGANNLFKAGYTQDSSGARGFYSGFNGTNWTSPSHYDITGLGLDTTHVYVTAGYKNHTPLGNDNIAFYSKAGGLGIYDNNFMSKPSGITPINNEIPEIYSMSQNYPNPFNPATTIKFSIPNSSSVKLTVYDLIGKAVATLVNGQLNAGNYSYSFDASNLASGVYLYRIQSDGFTDVKKMLLVK